MPRTSKPSQSEPQPQIDMSKLVNEMDRGQLGEHVAWLISHDRNESHGDPHEQFGTAQELKDLLQEGKTSNLNSTQREALEMICTKLSRIVHGGQRRDHWLDIAGYALIAAEATHDE